jgi:hypothetical protein
MDFALGLRKCREILRNTFARESLDTEPEAPPRPGRARSLARVLFSVEGLPEDPPPPPRPRRRDVLRALVAIEELPLDPEPAPRPASGPGVLRALLLPERLDDEPVEPARPSRLRWLAWLFRPESLDPP